MAYTSQALRFSTYANGLTPEVRDDGHWWVGNTKYGVAKGVAFKGVTEYYAATLNTDKKEDGVTPRPPVWNTEKKASEQDATVWFTSISDTKFGQKSEAEGATKDVTYTYLWNVEVIHSVDSYNNPEEEATEVELFLNHTEGRTPLNYITYYASVATNNAPTPYPTVDTSNKSNSINTTNISNEWKISTEYTGDASADNHLFEIVFVEYAETDANGANKFAKISGPVLIGHNATEPRTLMLDNDADVLSRNSLGIIISSLPVVNASVYKGNTLMSSPRIDLQAPTGWTKDTHYAYAGQKLEIKLVPSSFESGEFTFVYTEGAITLTKKFRLSVVASEVDYDIVTEQSLVNTTNGSGTVNIKVKKKTATGMDELSSTDGIINLYINNSETAEETWSASYSKGQVNSIHLTIKDTYGKIWDEEEIECVINGEDAVTYKLVASPGSWNKTTNDSITPTFTIIKYIGNAASNLTSGYTIKKAGENDAWNGSAIDETTTFDLYINGITNKVDSETVTAVQNGDPGDTGPMPDTDTTVTLYALSSTNSAPSLPSTEVTLAQMSNYVWSEPSKTPTEQQPYLFEATITKHVASSGDISYKNPGIPKLIAAWNNYGIDYAIYADYLVKTNYGASNYIYTDTTTGKILINASAIKSGALEVSDGSNIVFSANITDKKANVGGFVARAMRFNQLYGATPLLYYGLNEDDNAMVSIPTNSTNYFLLSPHSSYISNAICGATAGHMWKMVVGGQFGIDSTGKLYASSAQITGNITATSGSIGPSSDNSFKIEEMTMSSSVSKALALHRHLFKVSGKDYYQFSSETNKNYPVVLCPRGVCSSDTLVDGGSASQYWVFLIGKTSSNKTVPFGITDEGELYASAGKIGGWTIGSNSLTISGKKIGEAGSCYLYPNGAGTSVDVATDYFAKPTDETWVFGIGNNFGVTKGGLLYAKSLTIEGNGSITCGYLKVGKAELAVVSDLGYTYLVGLDSIETGVNGSLTTYWVNTHELRSYTAYFRRSTGSFVGSIGVGKDKENQDVSKTQTGYVKVLVTQSQTTGQRKNLTATATYQSSSSGNGTQMTAQKDITVQVKVPLKVQSGYTGVVAYEESWSIQVTIQAGSSSQSRTSTLPVGLEKDNSKSITWTPALSTAVTQTWTETGEANEGLATTMHFFPSVDSTRLLGGTGKRWKMLNVKDVQSAKATSGATDAVTITKPYATNAGVSSDAILQLWNSDNMELSFYRDWSANQIVMWAKNRALRIIGSKGVVTEGTWTGEWSDASDVRLKTDIKYSEDQIDAFFNQLSFSVYRYKDESFGKGMHFGFKAQEVLNSLYENGLDVNDQGIVGSFPYQGTQYFNLSYTDFIALNTWQIQKLKPRMTAAEQEIEKLKLEIQQLRAKLQNLQNS